jgi:molecular chaperone GrpE
VTDEKRTRPHNGGATSEGQDAARVSGVMPGEETVSTEEEAAASEVEADLAQLAQLESERDEYLDTLRRVQADFENYRKRVMKDQTALLERATEGLVEQLLPVLDSFDLALANLEAAGTDEKVRKGVELVYAELLGVLEKAGLSRIEAEGKPFDPNEHEAVLQEDGEGEPVVSQIMRAGYRFKGRVIRPAMVKVAR